VRSLDSFVRVQIELLVVIARPKSLVQPVALPTAVAIHADLDSVVAQQLRELEAGKLAPLIGVEELGTAMIPSCPLHFLAVFLAPPQQGGSSQATTYRTVRIPVATLFFTNWNSSSQCIFHWPIG